MSPDFADFEGCPKFTIDWSLAPDSMELDRELMDIHRPRFVRNASPEEVEAVLRVAGVIVRETFVEEIRPGFRIRSFSTTKATGEN